MPMNPCGGGAGGGRGGGGGFGGGGGGNAGPFVMPGTYNVALVVDGKAVETKPIKVIADPESQMNDLQRKRYNDILMDLHDMQRKGSAGPAGAQFRLHTDERRGGQGQRLNGRARNRQDAVRSLQQGV